MSAPPRRWRRSARVFAEAGSLSGRRCTRQEASAPTPCPAPPTRWSEAVIVSAFALGGCGPSIEPCLPAQCLALAAGPLEIGTWPAEWDTVRVYLERACQGGIAIACREHGSHGVTISNERPEERLPAVASLDRGCALGDGESCHLSAYHHAGRETQLHDRACTLGYEGGCYEAALIRSGSPDRAERQRSVDVLEGGCRAKKPWLCVRLVELYEEPPLADRDAARRARVLHCEAGARRVCTQLGFEAAVGLRTASDPAEAARLLLLGCESPADCDDERALARWLEPGSEPKALVRVLEAEPDRFVVELPPGVALPRGTRVSEVGWSIKINDVAGFQGVVIEERQGASVIRQKPMELGREDGSFSASLYLTPPKGSLVLLSWAARGQAQAP